MATPITWRNVAQAQQHDAARLFETGSEGLNKAIGGLSRLATQRGEQLDADQLNAALAQINSLNTVDGAREAASNGLIRNLGLSADQQLKASDALRSRINTLQNQTNLEQAFDDGQLSRQERGTVGEYQTALANKDIDLATELFNSLSKTTQGKLSGSLASARSDKNRTDFMNSAFEDIQNIPKVHATLAQMKRDLPVFADDLVLKDGRIQAREGGTLVQEGLDRIIADRYSDAVTSAPTAEDLSLQFLTRGTQNNIGSGDILSLQQLLQTTLQNDPVYRRQVADEAEAKRQATDITRLNTFENIQNRPVDERLSPNENLSVSKVLNDFNKYTTGDGGWFSEGDIEAFQKTAKKVYDKGFIVNGKRESFNPVVLREALNLTSAVQRAKQDGELGAEALMSKLGNDPDFAWIRAIPTMTTLMLNLVPKDPRSINEDELYDMLLEVQNQYEQNNVNRSLNSLERRNAIRSGLRYEDLPQGN